MQFDSVLNEAIQRINSSEQKREFLAKKLSSLRGQDLSVYSEEITEKFFTKPVAPAELDGLIAGVDSGFVGKEMFSIDLVLLRAIAAIFSYKKGVLEGSQYYPVSFKFPEPIVSETGLERDEFACSKSLYRLKEEVLTASETIKKFSPQFMFLDGSIVPQHADKPRKGSKIKHLYHSVLQEFQNLYSAAEKQGCELVACVEDSRGTRLISILQESVLQKNKIVPSSQLDEVFDSSLLDKLLLKGERSFAFPYTKNPEEHPVLADFNPAWARAIHCLYLKPSSNDKPLRIEFLHKSGSLEKKADNIASLVYALSCQHREYAFPSVLIEADLRSRLRPEEISLVFDRIMDGIGKNTFIQQRRDRRPFQ